MRALRLLILVAAVVGCDRKVDEPIAGAPASTAAAATTAAATASAKPKVPLEPAGELAGIRYVVYLAGHAHANDRLPTVVALHGRCDTPENYASTFETLRAPARVVIPYGTTACEGIVGFMWFDVDRSPDRKPEVFDTPVRGAEPKVTAFLAALPGALPMIGKPIVTGFSQGAMLSHAVAAQHPELVELAAPVAGFLPSVLAPPRREGAPVLPRVVAFHGDDDTAVPLGWDQSSVTSFVASGFTAELRRYPHVSHAFGAEELVDYLSLLDDTARRLTAR